MAESKKIIHNKVKNAQENEPKHLVENEGKNIVPFEPSEEEEWSNQEWTHIMTRSDVVERLVNYYGLTVHDFFVKRSVGGEYCWEKVFIVDEEAFAGCSGLEFVKIAKSITKIGKFAFSWCKNLTRVYLPASIVYIGYGAFADCNEKLLFVVENEEVKKLLLKSNPNWNTNIQITIDPRAF